MANARVSTFLAFLFLLLAVTASGQAIYKTPYGKKYHLGTCHMVKNVSEKITPAKARELGLGACSFCRPVLDQLRASAENKSKGQSKTVRCQGITRSGSRCKHHTSIANGYCFQHQPS